MRADGKAAPLIQTPEELRSLLGLRRTAATWRRAGECWEWTGRRDKDGYGVLHRRGHQRVHRLVFTEVFGDPGPLGVLHSCDNPCCGRPAHLFLGTAADNNRDCSEKGRKCQGARHPFRREPWRAAAAWAHRSRVVHGSEHPAARLTEEAVREIRQLKGVGARKLAAQFGVSRSTIRWLLKGKTWKHV